MTNQQTYTSRSNAKRAALADLGKDAVEGQDYQITKHQNGRFAYRRAVGGTKPDTCAKGSTDTQPSVKAKRRVSRRDLRVMDLGISKPRVHNMHRLAKL